MNFFTRLALLKYLLQWRLTWDWRNTHYRFPGNDNPKFMSPRQAAALIQDGSVIATSGMAANQRASVMYWAIRELFEETGHPAGLTIICTGGQGGRGKAPGTLEELGLDGLCTRFIAGHLETFKSILKLAAAGRIELQCLPQGIISLLFEAQGRGEDSIISEVGIDTFIDPRCGRGSPLSDDAGEQLVTVENNCLRYRLPAIDVAIFNLPAADRAGNIYAKNCAMIGESYEIAHAARKNGGVVIANVGLVVEAGYSDIFLTADQVDAVVAYPDTEQTGAVAHRKYWSFFTTDSTVPITEGISQLRFINRLLGITPRRSEISAVVARLAASIFAENCPVGAQVNIGVGLPEEVCYLLFQGGLLNQLTLFTEGGCIGGIPAPGVYFGACVCPERIISSAQTFHQCAERLDATILGALQVDSQGNVNVSKRGEGISNYVGPGGFIDLSTYARMVIFVCSWMAGGRVVRHGKKLALLKKGRPKFVDQVDEITFNGKQALARGQKVFYITEVGMFRLTEKGMELQLVFPGIDIERDILALTSMAVVLPKKQEVATVAANIVSGKSFRLQLATRK